MAEKQDKVPCWELFQVPGILEFRITSKFFLLLFLQSQNPWPVIRRNKLTASALLWINLKLSTSEIFWKAILHRGKIFLKSHSIDSLDEMILEVPSNPVSYDSTI